MVNLAPVSAPRPLLSAEEILSLCRGTSSQAAEPFEILMGQTGRKRRAAAAAAAEFPDDGDEAFVDERVRRRRGRPPADLEAPGPSQPAGGGRGRGRGRGRRKTDVFGAEVDEILEGPDAKLLGMGSSKASRHREKMRRRQLRKAKEGVVASEEARRKLGEANLLYAASK